MERQKKTKTGANICTLNDLNFNVEIRPETMPCNKEYSQRVIGQINGNDFLLNQCSNIYTLVKNVDIFPNIEKVLTENNIAFSVTYSHINNVRFYADYIIEDSRYSYNMKNTTDYIKPMLRVQHSYNGLTKYRIIFGYYRLVCTNGMTIPIQEMKNFNLVIVGKHTASIEHSFNELDKMLKYFAVNAKQITEEITAKYELLGGRMVTNLEDRITEVLNAVKMPIVDNSKFNTLNYITSIAKHDANDNTLGYNGRVNDFLLYNAINQYLNDDSRNIAVPEKRMETDSKVLEFMLINA